MKKLLYTLFALLFSVYFIACGGEEEITVEKPIYPATDSLFGYRFGSSMKEVDPQIIKSEELAINKIKGVALFYTFRFQQDKLSIISKYYSANILGHPFQELFFNDISVLDPPKSLKLIPPPDGEYITYIEKDSISWTNRDLQILVRNDYSNMMGAYYNYLVVEYKKKD